MRGLKALLGSWGLGGFKRVWGSRALGWLVGCLGGALTYVI